MRSITDNDLSFDGDGVCVFVCVCGGSVHSFSGSPIRLGTGGQLAEGSAEGCKRRFGLWEEVLVGLGGGVCV